MLQVVILAAGKGTRMRSLLPKVMHPLAGKPLVSHVIDTARALAPERIFLVVGQGAETVSAACAAPDIHSLLQAEQKGTGHAVAESLPHLRDDCQTLILYGDVPLIQASTLQALLTAAGPDKLGLVTVSLADPSGYGRIVRQQGKVTQIIEHKDATDAQRQIAEINTGILTVPGHWLKRWLPALTNQNAQGEYYLTDVIAMAVAEGVAIETIQPQTADEVAGVNDRIQLAALERVYQLAAAKRLMAAGATLKDPARIDIRGEVTTGMDCTIDINCVFEGQVQLGQGVEIGPNVVLVNCSIGDYSVIKAYSHIEGSSLSAHCDVGPYARLRPGTQLADGAKIGNFVETKQAVIGAGSKVNHLSYVGDATLGEAVNVGAGTITCNYDGANKHRTTIGDHVFVGSNTALVAPVTIHDGATIAAGSTITQDIAADQLAVARSRQVSITGWKRPSKAPKGH
jgi:bifunctional UDP-N-acetylglucosamine pyrophosphorylase / glucosamine-1-phosphate N-acetyltransferase